MNTNETGHAKNVANLEDLIACCSAYGAAYNPVKTTLQLTALTALKANADAALKAVIVANTAYMSAVNQRQIIFANIQPFATRLVNALAATNATDEKVENAKSINRKIQGNRKTPVNPAPADPNNLVPPIRHNSTSKQSVDSQIEELTKLMELVKAEPSYAPNEDDLKPTGLDALLINLSNSNTEVINTSTALSNARIARDKVLYTEDTGLVSIALDVKKYIKSVFGASSLEYKQVTSIPFKNTGAE